MSKQLALEYGPNPAAIDDWLNLSPWVIWFIWLIALVWFVVWVITRTRATREADAREFEASTRPYRTLCEVHGHSWRAHQTVQLCIVCGAREPWWAA